MVLLVCVLFLIGFVQAQDVWSDLNGVVSPGNNTGKVWNYDYADYCTGGGCTAVPGTSVWSPPNSVWNNNVEGFGMTTSVGVGCANAYTVGKTASPTMAELPASDRGVFKGFVCVNDPFCNPVTLGNKSTAGSCSMGRFMKITQVAQGWTTLGPLTPLSITSGTWSPNVTGEGTFICPQGQFISNIRCWKGSAFGKGCVARQVECSSFAIPLYRLGILQTLGGPFDNTGAGVPANNQGGWFSGACAFVGIQLTSLPSISFIVNQIQMKACAAGYQLNASYICVGKPCPIIPIPAFGSTNYTPATANHSYPSSAYFSCLPGYATTQTQNTQCQPDTSGVMYWTNPVIECRGVPCAPLLNPSNGQVSTTNNNVYPSTATFSCSVGYTVDYTTASCQTTGFWSPSTPAVCTGVPCKNDTSFYNSTIGSIYPSVTGGMRYPSTATYTCRPGYSFAASSQRLCTTDGSWFPAQQPVCVGVPCPLQSNIVNGNVSQTSLVYPSSAFYTCFQGYRLQDGSSVRVCGTDGVFAGSVPSCNPLPCTAPDANILTNININATASVATNNFIYPSTITYQCKTGFYPTGPLTVACGANGNYSVPANCTARGINVGSLLINNASTNILNATNGVSYLFFNGSFGLTQPTSITFGPITNPQAYPCTITSFIAATQSVRCTASAGVGSALTLAITLADPNGAVMYANSFMSFAAPNIRTNSLTAASVPGATGIIQSSVGGGDTMSFLCDHCGTVAGQLTVAFGAPLPYGIACGSITLAPASGDTQNVSCVLGAGAGGPLVFYLNVAGLTKTSVDTYKYPDGPVITSVRGCTTLNAGTTNCPCSGYLAGSPVVLIITGTLLNYSNPVNVKIAQVVYPVISANATTVLVNLPAGVGSSVSVQIMAGASYQSQVAFLLGYAAPLIANVSGCVNAAQCARAGGDIVTITGSNFGTGNPAALIVLVATYPCTNVIHDINFPDAQVTCKLSPGKGLQLGIFAIQPNGLLGSSPLGVGFAYAECPPGTYDNATGLSCILCNNGTFSAVPSQSACSQCAAGTYGPTKGLSSCVVAGQGYFVNTSGSNTRFPCAPGSFTASTQSLTCQLCSPGEYAASAAALSCLACAAGRATGEFASIGCTNCTAGTFSIQGGQTACENCLPGWAAPLPSAIGCDQCPLGTYSNQGLNCTDCAAGTFQNQPGSTTCVLCSPGDFSDQPAATACTACEQGKFQALYGQQNCTLCAVGTYSFQFGVIICSLCVQGTRQNETGQLGCVDCDVGKQALLPGASVCDDCRAGKFASAPRTVFCLDCLVSTATNLTGQSSCPQCLPGRYADSLGQTTCFACAVGTYASEKGAFVCSNCPPGAVAGATGSTLCNACSPGKFAKQTGLTSCDSCAVGFFSSSDGATICAQCAPGTYGNNTGLAACVGCPAGYFTDSPQSKECSMCAPGKFSTGTADICAPCASRTISLNAGSAACTACPNNAISNTQLTDCVCGPGYLRVAEFTNGVNDLECHDCYVGANCSSAGTTTENLQTLPGWWRSSRSTTTYYRCLVAAFCAGGVDSTCLGNRAGPLCVKCAPGYRSSRATSTCEICPPSAQESWTNSVLIMIAVGIAAVFVYWAVLRLGENQVKQMKHAQDSTKLQTLHNFRSASMKLSRTNTSGSLATDSSDESTLNVGAKGVPAAGPLDLAPFDDDYNSTKKRKNEEDPFSLASRRAPNFLYKIKIVIGFFQIANVISFQGDIAWPQLYQSFITLFQVLNLDFVPWQSIGCATGFDYYWKAIITGLIPVAVFILLLLGFVVPSMIFERIENYNDADTKRLKAKRMRAQLMKLTLFTVFLLYPHVSSTVLGVFNCIEVEGVYYLLNDFSLTCFDDRWTQFALPCIVFIIAYPIGIPLAYFFILRRNKAKFQDTDTIVAYGFLYEAYQDDTWFFELMDMVHKLILTSLVPFLPNDMEMACNMIVIILYMQIILVLQPYVRKGDDRLHQIVQAELCLLALLGWTLGNLKEVVLDAKLDFLISILLIILTVFLLLAFTVMTARNSFKLIQLFRRLRRKKNLQFQAERGGVLELCASDLKKKNHSGVWQDRYFVLCEDGFLEWYSSKTKERIVGIIPVSQILAVRDDPNPLRFSYDVKAEITVSFDLQAKDSDTAAKWVRCLQLLSAGNKVEKMDPSLSGQYWRDTTAMRMLRLQRSTSSRFKVSSGDSSSGEPTASMPEL